MSIDFEQRDSEAIRRRIPHDATSEINHRIANGLQLVSTFLSLQAWEIEDVAAKKVLKGASTRIAAIGRIQRALSLSGGRVVDLGVFLSTLCGDIEILTGLPISVEVDDDMDVEPAKAQLIGIAINELIINAAKHASEDRCVQATVTCGHAPGGFLLLTVADDGPGLPSGFKPEVDPSVGMTILRSAAHQLQGELTFRSKNGATAKLKFPMR